MGLATLPLAAIKLARDVNPGIFNALIIAGFGLTALSAVVLVWAVLFASIKLRKLVISIRLNENHMVKDEVMEIRKNHLVVRLARQQLSLMILSVIISLAPVPCVLTIMRGSVRFAYVIFLIATNLGWFLVLVFVRNINKTIRSLKKRFTIRSRQLFRVDSI
jgi:hypothetical protein